MILNRLQRRNRKAVLDFKKRRFDSSFFNSTRILKQFIATEYTIDLQIDFLFSKFLIECNVCCNIQRVMNRNKSNVIFDIMTY